MQDLIFAAVILGYVSLAFELIFLHVPSVASNRAIWEANKDLTSDYSNKFRWVFSLAKWQKFTLFFIPLAGVYVLFSLPILMLFNQDRLYSSMVFNPSPATNLIGILVLAFGRFITLRSVFTIRRNNSQQDEHFELYTDELFSSSRNPGLVGMYLFFLGIFVCLPSLWILVGLIYYVLYMHFKVKMEENFLSNKFGHAYQNYIEKTGRYL